MRDIQPFASAHPSGDPEDTGVHARLVDGGAIEILTDTGDSAVSQMSPNEARVLAAWLTEAADIADARKADAA